MSEPRLLGIFAHPDDEGVMGAAFLQYADAGVDTGLICATRGEARAIVVQMMGPANNVYQTECRRRHPDRLTSVDFVHTHNG
jgi:LmbE family N-acetylglucosaminyl deacetylase